MVLDIQYKKREVGSVFDPCKKKHYLIQQIASIQKRKYEGMVSHY